MHGVDLFVAVRHVDADVDVQVTARLHILIDARFLVLILCRLIVRSVGAAAKAAVGSNPISITPLSRPLKPRLMISFLIKWMNFLSAGGNPTEIKFLPDSPLTW